jgi:hypothetical protein
LVAIGAAAVAAVGAAMFVVGKGLQSVSEGMQGLGKVNGENLLAVTDAMFKLGPAMAVFAAGGLLGTAGSAIQSLGEGILHFFGGKTITDRLREFAEIGPDLSLASNGIMALTDGLKGLEEIDEDKIKGVLSTLSEIQNVQMAGMATSFLTDITAKFKGESSAPVASNTGPESMGEQLNRLNNTIGELLKTTRDQNDLMGRNLDAVKKLNPNLFAI